MSMLAKSLRGLATQICQTRNCEGSTAEQSLAGIVDGDGEAVY